jgi:multiple sugar transport system substrate-binding protein
MFDESLTWTKGGHIPTLRSLLESEAYRNVKPQSDYADSADIAVYDPSAWYGYAGAGSNFMTVVGSQIGLVQQGLVSPGDAMGTMRADLTRYADPRDPL